jgi:hypothetical protein
MMKKNNRQNIINIHCTTFNLASMTPDTENDILPIFMTANDQFVPDIYVVAI